jgi:hypothetical protein
MRARYHFCEWLVLSLLATGDRRTAARVYSVWLVMIHLSMFLELTQRALNDCISTETSSLSGLLLPHVFAICGDIEGLDNHPNEFPNQTLMRGVDLHHVLRVITHCCTSALSTMGWDLTNANISESVSYPI